MRTAQHPVLYYRDGCHLCEEMAAFLYRGWPDQTDRLMWVNVDADPQLKARFGADVPVLMVGEAIVCHQVPDQDKLTRCFGPAAIPV